MLTKQSKPAQTVRRIHRAGSRGYSPQIGYKIGRYFVYRLHVHNSEPRWPWAVYNLDNEDHAGWASTEAAALQLAHRCEAFDHRMVPSC